MHNLSDIKTITTTNSEQLAKSFNDRLASPAAQVLPYQLTCSIVTPTSNSHNIATTLPPPTSKDSHITTITTTTPLSSSISSALAVTHKSSTNPAESTHMTLLSMRRRHRLFQRRACLLSIAGAFVFGLALGVFVPMFGLANLLPVELTLQRSGSDVQAGTLITLPLQQTDVHLPKHVNYSHPPAQQEFPTIYAQAQQQPEYSATPQATTTSAPPIAVSFVREQQAAELSAEEVFRNAFHLEQDKAAPDSMIVKKLDASDGSIKEFHVQRTASGRFRKGPERRLSKPSLSETMLRSEGQQAESIKFVPMAQRIAEQARSAQTQGYIKDDIYWGDIVEQSLPRGFNKHDALNWNRYVASKGIVTRLETGCGRMQNRLVIFADGTRACARYRQNTDQIQGELFSFYLGQLLNFTNLAPSAAAVINLDAPTWSSALNDITQAQWKQQRPVVLTQWLPDLEPAGIPQPFQPLERHLNKYDVWNITLTGKDNSSTALETTNSPPPPIMQQLIELAQWSDLIVFDYLIANLDRVVNNLYNFQWNADIMAAPAHNLARQINSQLLVFLDNESGLLHGYRLLKKYEAYHGLLLDNLCVFRQPTIQALRALRSYGVGLRLREAFEQTTSQEVRDVLPSLPDKSIKILIERIDRVLGQVQKCRDLLADR